MHLKNTDALLFLNDIAYFFYLYRFLGSFCVRKQFCGILNTNIIDPHFFIDNILNNEGYLTICVT